jgi:hypothetical protein
MPLNFRQKLGLDEGDFDYPIFAKIRAYRFQELGEKAQHKAIQWLDELPLEYEDDDGNIQFQYFYELELEDIKDHCKLNNYLFDFYGNPIHHLLLEETK